MKLLLAASSLALAFAVLVSPGAAQEQPVDDQGPGRAVPDEGYAHVPTGDPITYANVPPSSGPHYGSWTFPGVYADPQAPGHWVHSLEHGYVVIVYNCPADCPELVAQLQQFYELAPKSAQFGVQKLVVTPYREMPHPLAIIAWGRVDELDAFDHDRLLAFYQAYFDRGPEAAP